MKKLKLILLLLYAIIKYISFSSFIIFLSPFVSGSVLYDFIIKTIKLKEKLENYEESYHDVMKLIFSISCLLLSYAFIFSLIIDYY